MAGSTRPNTNQDLDNPFILSSLTFASNAGTFMISGNPLRFVPINTALIQDSGSIQVINSNIELRAGNTTLRGGGGGQVQLIGTISNDGAGNRNLILDMAGTGSFALSGANTFTGNTTLTRGKLVVDNDRALGPKANTLVLNGGTIRASIGAATSTPITLDNPVTMSGNITFGTNESAKTLAFTGPLTLSGTPGNRTFTVNARTEFSGGMDEQARGFSITKAGTGRMVMEGINTYSGTTTVTGGALELDGQIGTRARRSGTVTAQAGTQLAGVGHIFTRDGEFVIVENNALMKVGKSPGLLTIDGGGLQLQPNSTFQVELGGPVPGNSAGTHSQLEVVGDVTLGGSILQADLTYAPSPADKLFILTNEVSNYPIDGEFQQGGMIDLLSAADGNVYEFQISYNGHWTGNPATSGISGGNSIVLYNAQVVSEPASFALMIIGLTCLGITYHRWRRKAVIS
jgi:autotransporter-associated beta strand protein